MPITIKIPVITEMPDGEFRPTDSLSVAELEAAIKHLEKNEYVSNLRLLRRFLKFRKSGGVLMKEEVAADA